MTALRPRPGFNPLLINWGGPDEPRTEHCSYCGDAFPEFCEACQARWFGLKRVPEPPDNA